jgi:diguanylate cyclase (GGDEF)-like protein
MVGSCYFCKSDFVASREISELLQSNLLKEFIAQNNPNWPAKENNACLNCLKKYQALAASRQNFTKKITPEDNDHTVISDEFLPFHSISESDLASLIIIHGPESEIGKKITVDKQNPTIIGRATDAHIQIMRDNVSRNHAKIYYQNGEYRIQDLGSTNGTLLNTVKITSEKLQSGDIILIGNMIFKFVYDAYEEQFYNIMYNMATLDGLTRIYNKKFVMDKLKYEIDRAMRYQRPLSLIMIDIDHFKKINDTYGHVAGDFVLKETSALYMQYLRKADILGRYGGEEFIIILPECHIQQAIQTAEKIRSKIAESVFRYETTDIKVTVSLGISANAHDAADPNFLIKTADRALYIAKMNGRNQIYSLQKNEKK